MSSNRPRFLSRLIFLIAIISLPVLPFVSAAPDGKTICMAREDQALSSMLRDFDELESLWLRHSETEKKIHLLYYGPLWRARVEALDHFNKDARIAGNNAEDYYEARLTELENQSTESANKIEDALLLLSNPGHYFTQEKMDSVYLDQLKTAYTPALDILTELRSKFTHQLELEREERLRVSSTSGRRKGLYPQDTLENADQHTDFYERFEQELAPAEFTRKSEAFLSFEELRRFFRENLKQADLCLKTSQASYQTSLEAIRE